MKKCSYHNQGDILIVWHNLRSREKSIVNLYLSYLYYSLEFGVMSSRLVEV